MDKRIKIITYLKEHANKSEEELVIRISRRVLSRRLKISPTRIFDILNQLHYEKIITIYKRKNCTNIIKLFKEV